MNSKGELDGIEVVVTKEIARRLGLTYKPVITVWEGLLVGILADKYDMGGTFMAITEERAQRILYSDAWIEDGTKMVVRANSGIERLDQIKGKKIGVLTNSIYVDQAKALGGDIKFYKSESDSLQDLMNGNIDAKLTEGIALAYQIKTTNLPLTMVGDYVARTQKAWPFKKTSVNLVKAVNKALADMVADGTHKRLIEGFIGFAPYPSKPFRSNFDKYVAPE
jgi:polar amino acid transport system substrate-binding protein